MPQIITQQLQHANKFIDYTEAIILLSHVLKKNKEYIISHPKKNVSYLATFKYKKLIKKRQKGVPIAYLTGHKEFYGLDFLVNKYTLIPRPDTELMIEEVIKIIQDNTQNSNNQIQLIDIGTGSGCIPISIIKAFKPRKASPRGRHKNIKTFAIDISKKALRIAKKNARKHNADITFLHGNLLQPILSYGLRVTDYKLPNHHIIITANLPYLTKEQFEQEKSIQHEPKSALIAKDDGLALYKELLQQIKSYVSCFTSRRVNRDPVSTVPKQVRDPVSASRSKFGIPYPQHRDIGTSGFHVSCFFEIDPSQSEIIKKLISNILPQAKIEIKKDLANNDRVVILNH